MPVTTKKKRKEADLGKLARNVGTVVGTGLLATGAAGAAVGGGYKVAKGAGKLGIGAAKAAYTAGKTGLGITKIPGIVKGYKAKKDAGKQAVKDLNKAAKAQPKRLPASTSATGPKTKTTKQIKKAKDFKAKVYGQSKNKPLDIKITGAPKGGQAVSFSKPTPEPKGGAAGRKYKAAKKKARKLYDKASPKLKPKVAKQQTAKLSSMRSKQAIKGAGKIARIGAGKVVKRAAASSLALIPGVGLPLAAAANAALTANDIYSVGKAVKRKRK